jgi:hypothetical protein
MKQTQTPDKRKPQVPVWNWRDAIRKSSMSTGAKCLCYSIANYLNDAGGYAYPPVKDLMKDMSCSNTTVTRCVKEAVDAGYLSIQRMHNAAGHLYGTHYHPRFPEEAVLATPALTAQKGKRLQSVNQSEKSSSGCVRPNEESPLREILNGDLERLDEESSRHNSPNKDPNKNKKTRANEQLDPKTWEKRDPFGLNPWQAKDHGDVRFDDDFRIVVCNGFEEELRERLKPAGLDLRDALDEAAKYVQRSAAPAELKIQVRSQIARLAREAKERAEVRAARIERPKTPAAGQTRAQRGRALLEARRAQERAMQ